MESLEILAREIRNVRASILNRLATRDAHPTYGITKSDLRADTARLTGLIEAHRIMVGRAPSNPGAFVEEYAVNEFEINIHEIYSRINAS